MNKRIWMIGIILGCILISSFWGESSQLFAADNPDTAAVVSGNTAFAIDLYGKLAQTEGNFFFSPYSISSALAMTYAGARGNTAAQMVKTLHFNLAAAKLHPALADLMKSLNTQSKNYQLSVANALWGQKGYPFNPEFVGITAKYYDAGFKEVDYIHQTEASRQAINQWVETKTNQKIKELIKPRILNELTRLVLTNAIYFKSQWELQFKPEQTQMAPFYSSPQTKQTVSLMHQTETFNYTENDQLQMVELPYRGEDLAMDILLPKPQSDLTKLESTLRPEILQPLLAKLSRQQMEIFIPRFILEKEFSLNDPLQQLGMTDAFLESKANFTGMSSQPLYITHVIHKTFVEVNEEGTEAAAATAVIMGLKSAPMARPVLFRADHPFVFMIRDLHSGSILFMGRLVQPN